MDMDPAEFVARNYPEARQGLAAAGRTDEDLDAMPAAQVVLLYVAMRYEQARDAGLKWIHVPYWMAEKPAELEQKRLADDVKQSEAARFPTGSRATRRSSRPTAGRPSTRRT
ncbi:MAG: hypothetical protein JW809_02605, partial [Pirellulales bacterium]|nr:hypothetical protein [Pirellulales bacterium]